MKAIVSPSVISGVIDAPASKSSMQRACAAALLFNGKSIINKPGHSNDDKASLQLIIDLGANVQKLDNGSLQIIGQGVNPIADQVNCGESGLGIRMFAPIISLTRKKITIKGEGSLLKRPMNFLDEVFPKLSVDIQSKNGFLPIA